LFSRVPAGRRKYLLPQCSIKREIRVRPGEVARSALNHRRMNVAVFPSVEAGRGLCVTWPLVQLP
jgi:hypothetical protein